MTDAAVQTPPKEEKTPFISNEVRVMMEGTEKRLYITDKDAKQHRIMALTMQDMLDFEVTLGVPVYQIGSVDLKVRHIMYLVYLSLRKEGCTKEDLEKRKFAYTEREVNEMFDAGFIRNSLSVMTDILNVSGFKPDVPPQTPNS